MNRWQIHMSARCWFLIAQWVSGRERSRVKRLANNHARIRRGLYLELTSCNGCENSQSFLHFTSESAFVPLKMAAQFRLGISHLVWKIARRTHRGIFREILFMCFNAHICRSYLLRSLANCFVCATQPRSDATEVGTPYQSFPIPSMQHAYVLFKFAATFCRSWEHPYLLGVLIETRIRALENYRYHLTKQLGSSRRSAQK